MRNLILTITILLLCTISANADYTYKFIDGDDFDDLTLYDHETLLMTGGEGHHLDVFYWSSATIQGTDPLIDENNGGIWLLGMAGDSNLDFSGGEIHRFDISSDARAVFSGGRIDEIRSTQTAWKWAGDPLQWVPDPHIEIVCRDHDWDEATNTLTGTWFDYSTFDIQLVDVENYDPVIENIFFTPEPATLLLISLGGLFLRHRCRPHYPL